jgi:hypothetical protein
MNKQTLTHQITLSNADVDGLLLMRTASSLMAEELLRLHRQSAPFGVPPNYLLYSRSLEMSSRFWDNLDFINKARS